MSITNRIKGKVKRELELEKQDDKVRKLMINQTALLLEKFFKKVQAGEIEIKDLRDAKDMAALYSEFFNNQDNAEDASNNGAPQVSINIGSSLDKSLGVREVVSSQPDDPEKVDISHELENLTPEQVAKMASDWDKTKNNENEKEW